VVNNGLIHRVDGAGESEVTAVEFRNNGEVRVSAGTLVVPGDSSEASVPADGGTYATASGATLDLRGPRRLGVGSSVSGSGRVALSGDIQVDGAGISAGELQLSSLMVRFRGVAPGSEYPVFESSGLTTFSGSVVLQAEPGWCPDDGDSLTPFRFGSYAGDPSIQVTDAEFSASPVWLADRVRFDISNVDCDVTSPTLSSVSVASSSRSDDLLERSITDDASDDRGVTAYEYVWRSGTYGGSPSPGTGSVRSFTPPARKISFADTSPESTWTLFVRAVDRKRNRSPWVTTVVTTPKAPRLIALGDSITAGHHKDTPDGGTTCHDPGYSYAGRLADLMNGDLPPQWAVLYTNLAQSGYETLDVVGDQSDDDYLRDSCGVTRSVVPLHRAMDLLLENEGSWNRVVVTVGVNDTNWDDVLKLMAPASQVPGAASLGCLAAENYFDIDAVRDQIAGNVDTIQTGLEFADPAARIGWNSLYNPAGSGPLNARCWSNAQSGMNDLHSAIWSGLSGHNYVWHDNTDMPADGNLQDFFGLDLGAGICGLFGKVKLEIGFCENQPGWPHPNPTGAQRIAANDYRHLN
jgi:lysophospholipase L1-like esterase